MTKLAQVGDIVIEHPKYGINPNENGGQFLNVIIKNAFSAIFGIAAVLLIFMLLWGGIDWIMSGGDKEKAASARKKITSALIGLVVIGFTFFIASVIGQIVGFNPLQQLNIPQLNKPF